MLLTDGLPNTVEDLRVYESAILDVANTERIDLKTKLGLATEEVSEDVLDFLLDDGRAADPKADTRRTVGVSDVVVTRQMKRWHAIHTIALVYRDALHNQLNERYGQQFEHYWRLTREARGQTVRFGIGLVGDPIPAPVAPVVLASAAAGAPAAIYYVRITWAGAGAQESAPSKLTAFDAAAGTVPAVQAVNPPTGITGFYVYMGDSPERLMLQNVSPTPVSDAFVLPGSGLVDGSAPGDGQAPDVYVAGTRVMRRG